MTYVGECSHCNAADRIRELEAEVLLAHEQKQRIRELEAALHVAEDNEEERAGQVVGLDEKVRELEAELRWAREGVSASNPSENWWPKNITQKVQRQMVMEWKARAEKAESLNKQLEDIANTADATMRKENTLRLTAEARVAEIDGQLGGLMDYIVSNGLRLPNWTKSILEAREREAE